MRVHQFLNMYIFLAGWDRAAGKIDESMIKNESTVYFAYAKTDRGVLGVLNRGFT